MRNPYWEWQDKKVTGKRTWLLPERTWIDQSKSYWMSLIPGTSQSLCGNTDESCSQPMMKVTGIGGWRIRGRIRQWGGRDQSDNCYVFNDLDEKSNLSQTIQFISDDQICEVVVQGSWVVNINIDVTCVHITSTAKVGGSRHTVFFECGSHKCSVVATKILPQRPPANK